MSQPSEKTANALSQNKNAVGVSPSAALEAKKHTEPTTNQSTENVGFFPGFFDPDGRPWTNCPRGLTNYLPGLEAAIKVALITQECLYLPVGYILDNPGVQRLFAYHSGDNQEARCFRALVSDLVRIAVDSSVSTDLLDNHDWVALRRHWIEGSITSRQQLVYVNSLSHEDAEELMSYTETKKFERDYESKLWKEHRVSSTDFLDICRGMRLKHVEYGHFPFASLLEDKLLSGKERFSQFTPELHEKIHEINDVAKKSYRRISRSLIRDRLTLLDLGLKAKYFVHADEYALLTPVLQHYHQFAFAKASDLDGFGTRAIPEKDELTQRVLSDSFKSLYGRSSKKQSRLKVHWPLQSISFEDIYKFRCGKNRERFIRSLNAIHDSIKEQDEEFYLDSLNSHASLVQTVIPLNLAPVNSTEIIKKMGSATFPSPQGATAVALFAGAFMHDLIPNVRKELQLRWFFRQIKKQL